MSSGAPSGQAISDAAADAVYTQLGAGLLQQYCFPASTKITTRRGELPIEQVIEGDEVSAANQFDPSGPIRWKRVIELYRNKPAELINIHVGDLPVIRATLNHPFYVRDKGFIPAADLKPGDVLRSVDGWLPVTETFRNGDVEPVFNFCVEEWHTYFAGGVLVHNDSFEQAYDKELANGVVSTVEKAQSLLDQPVEQLAGRLQKQYGLSGDDAKFVAQGLRDKGTLTIQAAADTQGFAAHQAIVERGADIEAGAIGARIQRTNEMGNTLEIVPGVADGFVARAKEAGADPIGYAGGLVSGTASFARHPIDSMVNSLIAWHGSTPRIGD